LDSGQPARRIAGKVCVGFGGEVIPGQRQHACLDVETAARGVDAQYPWRWGAPFAVQAESAFHGSDAVRKGEQALNVFAREHNGFRCGHPALLTGL
jgi:hypothetical protein